MKVNLLFLAFLCVHRWDCSMQPYPAIVLNAGSVCDKKTNFGAFMVAIEVGQGIQRITNPDPYDIHKIFIRH